MGRDPLRDRKSFDQQRDIFVRIKKAKRTHCKMGRVGFRPLRLYQYAVRNHGDVAVPLRIQQFLVVLRMHKDYIKGVQPVTRSAIECFANVMERDRADAAFFVVESIDDHMHITVGKKPGWCWNHRTLPSRSRTSLRS